MMMRMIKKVFALLLTVAMLVCILASCNIPKEPVQANSTPNADATTTLQTNSKTLNNATTLTKITSINITSGKSPVEKYAASELGWYLAKKNILATDNGYNIALYLDASIANQGYRITADESGLVIAGGDARGLIYGLYAFLDKFVGVSFYSVDTTVIDDSDVMVGIGVLDELDPAFEVARNPWYPIERLSEENGGNHRDRETIKTFYFNTIVENNATPFCLSNPENINRAISKVTNYLWSVPHADILKFAPTSDADTYCACEGCSQIIAEEGSPSGVYVRFLNVLYEAISPRFPNVKMHLVIGAYLEKAPSLTKPADDISVLLNTKKCHISHPVTDTSCPDAVRFAESMKSWSAICDTVCVDYVLTSTTEYMPVFANLGSLRENMNFFATCGVGSINFTGNIACPAGDFGELRVYLVSQLVQNPMMSEEEYYAHMDEFLQAFYGDGWEYIRKFIDKTIELSADGHQTASGSHFDSITEEEYLANEEAFDEWWNKAEELAGDRIDFVKRARYQWRYIKLCLHPNAEDAMSLIADASNHFHTRVGWREKQWNVDVEKSNLNLAPTEWVYKS